MQTVECTCLPFLQRWPTPRTQKDPFHKEVPISNKSYGATLTPPSMFLNTLLGDLAQCQFTKKGQFPWTFCTVSSVLGFSTRAPLQALGPVEENTSLRTGMDTKTDNDKRRLFLLVFVATVIHFRSSSHTYVDSSSRSFPDTSLSKASPAPVNWAAPSSFSLE